jgi:uncharacterized YigZ family protein
MDAFYIPVGISHYQQTIKHSRFLAWVKHTETPAIAKAWFVEISTAYPDARHVCWAYIAGAPNTTLQSMSDDGEPSGTAGKPMLNVLQHSGAGEIAAVVVRYFGGTKLGTGGLARAYSSSVSETLKQATLRLKIPYMTITLNCPFADEHTIRHLLKIAEGSISEISYHSDVTLHCQLPESALATFIQQLPLTVTVQNQ